MPKFTLKDFDKRMEEVRGQIKQVKSPNPMGETPMQRLQRMAKKQLPV